MKPHKCTYLILGQLTVVALNIQYFTKFWTVKHYGNIRITCLIYKYYSHHNYIHMMLKTRNVCFDKKALFFHVHMFIHSNGCQIKLLHYMLTVDFVHVFFLIRIENNIDLYSELCFFFKKFFKNAVKR